MTASKQQKLVTAERRNRLAEMVRDGRYTWTEIADALGYADRASAYVDYRRLLEQLQKDTALTVDESRVKQLANLEETRRVAVEVMRTRHPFVQGGKIVRDGGTEDDPGEVLYDQGPVLSAIDRIAKIDAQIANLLGLNAPTKVEADGVLKVIVESTDFDVENLK